MPAVVCSDDVMMPPNPLPISTNSLPTLYQPSTNSLPTLYLSPPTFSSPDATTVALQEHRPERSQELTLAKKNIPDVISHKEIMYNITLRYQKHFYPLPHAERGRAKQRREDVLNLDASILLPSPQGRPEQEAAAISEHSVVYVYVGHCGE